jgi:hypothetical protein
MVRNQGRVTRFVVMAVLQAARAHALGLPLEPSYSWGLNRAIFYAAAKRGFSGTSSGSGEGKEGASARSEREVYRLGEDEAYRDPKASTLLFAIGDQSQTPADFEKGVISRFGTHENFRAAWDEAQRIMASYDRATLGSPRRFYDEVYKPRRDNLSDDWTRKYSPPRRTK